ncbi:hypothetical protein SAMN06295885_2066 [Rathayibacter oskolensis]|uniref:Uncharacterized protein n=1 Tax=Rathayibacter oskolensis TaxID=1891671 RepID=A0A1X7NWT2_9MICO|nr:hypothetical protein SAMN06295885_2066 [Rathayibacter oskolensis]
MHLARFGVITGALAAAAAIGIPGWYLGLTANVACVVFASALVTWRRLWRTSGILAAGRGRTALLLVFFAAATARLSDRCPH